MHKAHTSCVLLLKLEILPALRSLGIERDSGNNPKLPEGHRWREDDNGNVLEADAKRPAKQYDGNSQFIKSSSEPRGTGTQGYISKRHHSKSSLLFGSLSLRTNAIQESFTSLSRFPKLQRLILSGGNVGNKAFVLGFGMIMIMASPTVAMLLIVTKSILLNRSKRPYTI